MKYFKNMRIQERMLTLILSVTIAIYVISFGYIIFSLRNNTLQDAENLTATQAREYANLVKADINRDFELSRGLGLALANYPDFPEEDFNDIVHTLLREYLVANPNFFSVWVSLELNTLLPDYHLPHGRVRKTYVRQNGNIIFQEDTLNTQGDDIGSLYWQIKQDGQVTLTDPYWYSYTGEDEDLLLEVSPAIPLMINGHFAGLAGTDIILERFQEMAAQLNPFGVGYAVLFSNDGSYVAHPDASVLGQNISEIRPSYADDFDVLERIERGDFFSHYFYNDAIGEESYIAYAPIYIGDTHTPWSFAIVIPRSYITAEANRIFLESVLIALLGLGLLSLVIYLIARNIASPLKNTIHTLDAIALGDISNARELKVVNNDEIGEMSQALNKLLAGLKNTATFAQKIGEGKLDEGFEKLSNKDVLGTALLNMRSSLKQAREEEVIRKQEDEKRRWANEGLTLFADILRKDNDDLGELSFNLVKNLVNYLHANQAGIFVLNDDNKNEPYLELAACYAFDRKKYLEKKILIGEGLVGACFMEKATHYMTDIPQDYVRITSGLGGENPSSLLIVPLILNEEAFGVIEIASFRAFLKHEIEFVEKVAENIASTISGVKINMQTAHLLEQSQQQAEEMRAQEEEMRQNMEEMAATQEEMARKDKDYQNLIETSEKMFCVMEYDTNGNIISVNHNFERVSGYQADELKGQHISILFDNKNWQSSANYKKFWELLREGNPVKGALRRFKQNGEYFIVKGISNPVFDENGQLIKVMEITIDISKEAKTNK